MAFMVDVFARRMVGWRGAGSMTTALVLDALEQAMPVKRYSPARFLAASRRSRVHQMDWFNLHKLLEPIGNLPLAGLERAYYLQ